MGSLLLASRVRAQTVFPRLLLDVDGGGAGVRVGQSVSPAGDLNGDGIPDFAVGLPTYGPVTADSTGRVLVFFGGRTPSAVPDLVLDGEQRGSLFGQVVQPAGDVNGDGFDDLIVTALNYRYPNRDGSGRAYIYYGGIAPSSQPGLTINAPTRVGLSSLEGDFGIKASSIGDMDHDGYGDFVFEGADSPGNLHTTNFVYRGGNPPTGRYLIALGNPGWGRTALCGPGDLNGDGFDDLVTASPEIFPGRVSVCYLCAYYKLRNQSDEVTVLYSTPVPGFGSGLAAAGDLDHDGRPDLVIGHPYASGGGTAYLYASGSGLHALTPPAPVADSFGTSVAAGDVDGDGNPEILIGAPGGGIGAGMVYLYRAYRPDSIRSIGSWQGSPGDHLGYGLAVPGDLDGNGVAEILVGAPGRVVTAGPWGQAQLVTLTAHSLEEPLGWTEWRAGHNATVRWAGVASARVSLSLDGGATWGLLLDGVGGAAENQVSVPVPDTESRNARVRITPAGVNTGAINANTCRLQIVRDAAADPAASDVAERQEAPAGARRYASVLDAGGDLDGDGVPDAVIGAPLGGGGDLAGGAAWIHWGGVPRRDDRLLTGERSGDQFGASLSLAGDVDGDGRADLLVGAPLNASAASRAGRAYLYLGGDFTAPPLTLQGPVAGEEFGRSVTILRDMNGDGHADLAIASPFAAPRSFRDGTGLVRVFLGGAHPDAVPDLLLRAPQSAVAFGSALASLDLDGDGRSDLVVTSGASDGRPDRVFVYFGSALLDTVPDLVLTGEHAGDGFGAALANAGDLNGDGVGDLLVGAPQASGANGPSGRVYLFTGGPNPASTPARVFEGAAPYEFFGQSLAGAGDLNQDGRDDFAVGAPGASGVAAQSGACRVFFGGSDATADLEWTGGQSAGWFGAPLAGAGDTDGDGRPELLAGAPLTAHAGRSETGGFTRLFAPRFVVDEPGPAARWFGGGRYTVRWRGREPAEVALSVDAGRSWQTLGANVGGSDANVLEMAAPSVVTDSAYVRVRSVRAPVPGPERVAGPIRIERGGRLIRFEYDLAEDGIHLSWEAEPRIGPQGWSGYRLYREPRDPSGAPERVGPAAIADSAFVVAEFARGVTYELRGVDGNGEEAALGRVSVADVGARLRIWPVPSDEWEDVNLAIFPPVDAAGRTSADFVVRIFDLAGRELLRVAGGVTPTRVGEVRARWDRRDRATRVVGPGVYFVRAESPSAGFRIDGRLVLLR